jgi:PhzF family phenazine biosynthesis protein
MDMRFRLLNVFSIGDDPFSGNALCVFEEAAGLDAARMQAWARQFNLSETTFVTRMRIEQAEADVRIFTASYEMPFAGHPTLGTAHVVADLAGGRDAVRLTMPAGIIPVRRVAEGWQLQVNPATTQPLGTATTAVAEVLGIPADALVADGSHFVDAGVQQLLVQVRDADTVRACAPDARALGRHLSSQGRPPQVYVWAWTGERTTEARFFAASDGMVEEDPATGSAASNFGSWLALGGSRGDRITIEQGAQVGRPSRLFVTIDDAGTVFVAGQVTEVGSGAVHAD